MHIVILASLFPGGEACIPIAATPQLRPLASTESAIIELMFAVLSSYMHIMLLMILNIIIAIHMVKMEQKNYICSIQYSTVKPNMSI